MRRFFALSLFALAACTPKESGGKPFNPPAGDTHAEAQPTKGDLDFVSQAEAPKGAPDQVGLATWYGAEFAGKKTASGERFDPRAMTAAHRKLPFGTWVEVRRPDTGRTIRVKVNDRGPWGDDRKIIDLSRKAAEALDIVGAGVMRVELRVVSRPD
jgi:rare lipoprotein A